jgi:hypothetical protein
MRLLHVETRQLQDFVNPPPYAILSHTWDSIEVTYQDMQHGTTPSHPGYSKIEYTCTQAVKDNYQWVWIDTCCIDKSSSAELSEAINSMFQWYSRSKVCYAFLSDVDSVDDRLLHVVKAGHFEDDDHELFHSSQLSRSRWFTRGWTLQELLAPPKILFFGRVWKHLGTKITLARCISTITRIPEHVIKHEHKISENYEFSHLFLQSFSVAERMSWTATRQTTRIEDISYSLLGIFNVNMPLLYGEGAKAFKRLQEEIMKTSADHSIFIWDRALTGERFLAPSPKFFYTQRRILSFDITDIVTEPYAISNVGLTIKLPVSRNRRGETFCVLGCIYEDNPRGLIGVILERENDFYIFKQNFVVDFEDVEPAFQNIQTLQMRGEGPTSKFLNYADSLTRNRFIVVNVTEKDISHVYPGLYWNQETKVICFPEGTRQVGAFSIKLEAGYLVVIFGSRPDFPLLSSSWVSAFHVQQIERFIDVVRCHLSRTASRSTSSDVICNEERFQASINEERAYIPELGRTVTVKRTDVNGNDVKRTVSKGGRHWRKFKKNGKVEKTMAWLHITPRMNYPV